ncbi:MAG: MoxR family ATPase, partial [Chloroflexi bacterium]|nr:MoxR family ATPase [Chloroflexota bacterium]
AVALPPPTPVAESTSVDGGSGVTLDLAGGRKVRVRGRADGPPAIESANGSDGVAVDELRRALRAEYGLNLASSLGHVPPARSVLPCLTASSWQALRLTQGALVAGRPVFLRGPTGCGKSALARTLAHLWNLPAVEFSLTGETSKTDLTAARRLTGGATSWSIQGFLEAASEGLFVIVNEYNLAYPDVHSIINGLFDKGGRLLLPDGRVVHAHPDFRLVATGFAEGPGVKPLNEAVENRFGAVIRMDYPPLDEEAAILAFVAGEAIDPALLHAAAELAATGRSILSGAWDRDARHPLNDVPADLAGAAAERVSLTTAELVTSARAGDDAATFVRWLRRGVLDGSGDDIRPVLEATLAGYGLV